MGSKPNVRAQAVSIRAERAYIDAINQLASENGKSTADFTRELFDSVYGEQLKPLVNFFVSRANKNRHLSAKVSGE